MKLKSDHILCFLLFASIAFSIQAQSPTGENHIRKIVIDAGHGGKTPGAVGKTLKEKDVVLSVALKAGKLIKADHPDVEVIYTRDKDVFLELWERSNIANKNNADLFISIHANSVANRKNNTASGYETYIMGPSKAGANMTVAMQENSVIAYEDDYETKYQGYDPKNPESFIIFSLLQNTYLDQSLMMASLVQDEMGNTPIKNNRGVKQGPFLVLWKTAMPSILIELAFISNQQEEELMKKDATLNSFAKAISNAFSKYKAHQERQHKGGAATAIQTPKTKESEQNTGKQSAPVINEETKTPPADPKLFPKQEDIKVTEEQSLSSENDNKNTLTYSVQLFVSRTNKPNAAKEFQNLKKLDNVRYYKAGKMYKYVTGTYSTVDEAQKTCVKLQKLYPDAFVVGIRNETIVPVKK